MHGQTFTSSNKAWLVNTMENEVREMWFTFAIKCLHIAHSTTVLHDFFKFLCDYPPPKTPWARKSYNDFSSLNGLIFSQSSVAYFLRKKKRQEESEDVRLEESEDGPFPRKFSKILPGLWEFP